MYEDELPLLLFEAVATAVPPLPPCPPAPPFAVFVLVEFPEPETDPPVPPFAAALLLPELVNEELPLPETDAVPPVALEVPPVAELLDLELPPVADEFDALLLVLALFELDEELLLLDDVVEVVVLVVWVGVWLPPFPDPPPVLHFGGVGVGHFGAGLVVHSFLSLLPVSSAYAATDNASPSMTPTMNLFAFIGYNPFIVYASIPRSTLRYRTKRNPKTAMVKNTATSEIMSSQSKRSLVFIKSSPPETVSTGRPEIRCRRVPHAKPNPHI